MITCLIFLVLAVSQILFIQQGFKLAQRQLNSNDKEYKFAQKVLDKSISVKGDDYENDDPQNNVISLRERF